MKPTESPSSPIVATLAAELAQGLPAPDRPAGLALLEHDILPLELREVPHAERPQPIIDQVAREVAETLAALPAAERLHGLRALARAAEMREQRIVSQALCIARYLHEHPEALPLAEAHHWRTWDVDLWRVRSIDAIVAEATLRRARLARWEDEVRSAYPKVWEQYRFDALLVRYCLGPARTGVFTEAVGNLADFLRDVGADVKRIEMFRR